jgi:endonuclease/exonuclease/phosphatase family metal-dependent hydrolase
MSNIAAYYTGTFELHSNDQSSIFCGSLHNTMNLWSASPLVECLWETSSSSSIDELEDKCNKPYLYFGGILVRNNRNTTDSDIKGDIYRDAHTPTTTIKTSQAKQAIQKRLLQHDTISLNILSLNIWDMFMVENYMNSQDFEHYCYELVDTLKPVQGEVAFYDKITRQEIRSEWRDVRLGRMYAVTIDEFREKESLKHKILVNVDTSGLASIVSHIWERNSTTLETSTSTTISIDGTSSNIMNDEIVSDRHINLRVMTYNIWHNNPPSYLYGESTGRWKRYYQRLKHLASIITQHNPDIILLQEVRLDSTFRNPSIYEDAVYKYYDAGSQLDHLLGLLNKNEYHSVFQPMMSFITTEKLTRNEEGVAILSKYEIVDIDTLLLPRNFGDSSDNHQRGVLCAKVKINNTTYIDFMTTHFSLSHESRIASSKAIRQYSKIRENKHKINNNENLYFQIFGGDLNAEPHEESLDLLTKRDDDYELIDTWSYKNHHDQGYTFPTDEPIKRIDFILLKNMTGHNNISIVNSRLVGNEPTEETKYLIRPKIGMLDRYSPIYASDHLGLYTDFIIK